MAKKSEGEPRIHRNFLRSQCRAAMRCWIETERESKECLLALKMGPYSKEGETLLEAGHAETIGSLQKFYKIKHFCRYFDFNPLVCTIDFCS